MTQPADPKIVTTSRTIAAPAAAIFELIAEPSRQPEWDGNDNLANSVARQRVHHIGDIFETTLTSGALRQNHIVEFEEGRRIAWRPSEPDAQPPGHLWRWELDPVDEAHTSVIHTYDWTRLHDVKREVRARATTSDKLAASVDRLATLAEG
jgi:uncharacterized protein YndB with AHSA1/START domain